MSKPKHTLKECIKVVRERLRDAGVDKCPVPLDGIAEHVRTGASLRVTALPNGNVDVMVLHEEDKSGQIAGEGFQLVRLPEEGE